VAGKTGTISNRTEEEPNPDPLLTYSWFVGFAPIATPTIAVSALVVSTPTWYIKGAYLASETVVFHHLHAQP
jgi:cell division protein FtsI/penicillin-binding protein 2